MKPAVSLVVATTCVVGALSLASGAIAAAAPTPTPAPTPAPTVPTTTPAAATTVAATVPPTTLPPVPAWVANPACARVVQTGDSISLLADLVGNGVVPSALLAENGFGAEHVLHPGDVLDVCVGNDVNDLNGASRLRPPTTLIRDADPAGIEAQQRKLNELFGPYGMTPLSVDGRSGPLTRQQLCAARVLLGLPISRSDMAAGSEEEAELLALTALPIPPGAPTAGGRWALIDMTCEVFFAGEGATALRYIWPTSTGQAGFETRVVSEAAGFRFDPALDNGGWHDSSEFPAAYDNPLNGNMYKPLYFSNGQAIHGANNVPPQPASKGCVRLSVDHQNVLVGWLGLADVTDVVWAESRIDLLVTTQGTYQPDP